MVIIHFVERFDALHVVDRVLAAYSLLHLDVATSRLVLGVHLWHQSARRHLEPLFVDFRTLLDLLGCQLVVLHLLVVEYSVGVVVEQLVVGLVVLEVQRELLKLLVSDAGLALEASPFGPWYQPLLVLAVASLLRRHLPLVNSDLVDHALNESVLELLHHDALTGGCVFNCLAHWLRPRLLQLYLKS